MLSSWGYGESVVCLLHLLYQRCQNLVSAAYGITEPIFLFSGNLFLGLFCIPLPDAVHGLLKKAMTAYDQHRLVIAENVISVINHFTDKPTSLPELQASLQFLVAYDHSLGCSESTILLPPQITREIVVFCVSELG